MFNVIKSELYKTRHRWYPFIYTGVFCGLGLGLVLIFASANRYQSSHPIHYDEIAVMLMSVLSIGSLLTVPIVDIVFSDEYKHQTMKNSLSFGISRPAVYLGKLAVQLVVALLMLAAILTVTLGGAYLFLGDNGKGGEITKMLLIRLVGALPLWIGSLCLVNMLAFLIKNSTLYSLVFVGVFLSAGQICQVLGVLVSPAFAVVRDWLISTQFDHLTMDSGVTGLVLAKCAAIGLGMAVLSTVAGILLFRRREVK